MNETTERINTHYSSITTDLLLQEYYENSSFLNYGFWRENTKNPKEACENLMEELLASIPRKTGNILDVACGMGATTRHLLNYYKPKKVTGINISETQLEICKKNAPKCKFLLMDATKLDFKNNSFNNVICVEAAFHFDTRKKFLEEVFRVLKPKGKVVLSDILTMPLASHREKTMIPKENYLENIESYRSLLRETGFCKEAIRDETRSCWGMHFYNIGRFLRERLQQREIGFLAFRKYMVRIYITNQNIFNYLLVTAEKPR